MYVREQTCKDELWRMCSFPTQGQQPPGGQSKQKQTGELFIVKGLVTGQKPQTTEFH